MGDKSSAEKISQSDCEHEYKRAGIETPGVCDTSYGNLFAEFARTRSLSEPERNKKLAERLDALEKSPMEPGAKLAGFADAMRERMNSGFGATRFISESRLESLEKKLSNQGFVFTPWGDTARKALRSGIKDIGELYSNNNGFSEDGRIYPQDLSRLAAGEMSTKRQIHDQVRERTVDSLNILGVGVSQALGDPIGISGYIVASEFSDAIGRYVADKDDYYFGPGRHQRWERINNRIQFMGPSSHKPFYRPDLPRYDVKPQNTPGRAFEIFVR
ncbi:MAG: hypothetical protein IPI39_02615 [Candidatus Obscuribacter sp.]|nr:hypothetical protein [Candidatus Obscuribacter sp.]